MKINLVRIDDRLIHGQVATVWSKEANAQRIIICSDEVAKDQIRKTLLLQVPVSTRLAYSGQMLIIITLKQFLK